MCVVCKCAFVTNVAQICHIIHCIVCLRNRDELADWCDLYLTHNHNTIPMIMSQKDSTVPVCSCANYICTRILLIHKLTESNVDLHCNKCTNVLASMQQVQWEICVIQMASSLHYKYLHYRKKNSSGLIGDYLNIRKYLFTYLINNLHELVQTCRLDFQENFSNLKKK